jgi:hypothetical protein
MAKKTKPATKKKAGKATVKKAVVKKKVAAKRKSTVVKKKTVKKKPVTPARKPIARTIIKKITEKPVDAPQKESVEIDQPPVKETSPEINTDIVNPVEDIVTKSTQKEAARQYDNHHIRLSGKKGGFKPSGKKPLW